MRPNMTEKEFADVLKRHTVRGPKGRAPRSDTPAHTLYGPAKSAAVAGVRLASQTPSLPYHSKEFTLIGQLPSGKNQVQLVWRNGKVHRYPNKTFTNWRSTAHVQMMEQGVPPVMTMPVRLICAYWPGDRRVRDVSGQLDALFSLLVTAKVLKNDGLVYDVVWTRFDVADTPQLHLEIRPWTR